MESKHSTNADVVPRMRWAEAVQCGKATQTGFCTQRMAHLQKRRLKMTAMEIKKLGMVLF